MFKLQFQERDVLTASLLFNSKTRIVPFLNPYSPRFSYSQNPVNMQPHSSNSNDNETLLYPHFTQSLGLK